MATDSEINQLKQEIDANLSFKKDALIHRDKWGEITFDAARRDFDRIFDILNHLKVLPLEYLTDTVVRSIAGELGQIKQVFEQIDKFGIQDQNPANTRNSLVSNVHSRADSIYTIASPWIPFLAYQRGDVAKNIEQLTSAVASAKTITDTAQAEIANKRKEIDNIITKAREASASAGAAVFTRDFQIESEQNAERAKTWLTATWRLALVTVIAAASHVGIY